MKRLMNAICRDGEEEESETDALGTIVQALEEQVMADYSLYVFNSRII
jgi:hypothetical protein